MAVSSGSGNKPRIGLLGGTFDPIHNGHIKVATTVRKRLGLTQVIFIPTGQPWMKCGTKVTPAIHRLAMLRRALQGKTGFGFSTLELERTGPTYTVDTLTQLQIQYRGEKELYFILSWNTLTELPRWKDPDRIITLCYLVAVPRPGYSAPDLRALETKIRGITKKVVWLDQPWLNISATRIRERVAEGQPINRLVPPKVADYIQTHRLYLN